LHPLKTYTFARRTVSQLHQAVVVDGVVAVAGVGIEVDPLDRRQGIDVALGLPEVGL
jgi:hypothetical protein